jgi:IS5 family transposase
MEMARDDHQQDLLRPALAAVIDLGHPLVRLAREIDWEFLDRRLADVCTYGAGQPPLPTRLVASVKGGAKAGRCGGVRVGHLRCG